MLILFWVILLALMVKTGWIMIVQGEELSRAAVEQQTRDRTIPAPRGNIYDRNGEILATSMTVEQIQISPRQIRDDGNRELVADGLSRILEIDRDIILSRIDQEVAHAIIVRRIERDVADEVRDWVEEVRASGATLRGIHINDDIRRHYRFNSLASHLIGFVGDDNQGIIGLEAVFDEYLRGTPGRIITATDASGREMNYRFEQRRDPIPGMNLVLTIDEVIQHITEKHLEIAFEESALAVGGAAIVMDVQTGEILAMATKPDFDLNAAFTIPTEVWSRLDTQSQTEHEAGNPTRALNRMWRNTAVVDSYEPGSTFKITTAAIGMEQGVVSLEDRFYCRGYVRRDGWGQPIRCHNRNGHGMQTFVEAVQNSCNPAFIEIAERVGIDTFYRYIHGMGYTERTGIEFPGETSGLFWPRQNFNPIELVTASFGQGFQVTPLQLITIISATANGGNMHRPRLVRQMTDVNGNVVQSFEPEFVRQIVSRQTSDTLNAVLENTVTFGTGRNAYIPGFRVAGKTGTSEKVPRGQGNYIASFVGFAPANNPRIAVLVILDEPTRGSHFGGQIAAPVARNILEESLQYLGIEPEFTQEEMANQEIPVPDLVQMERAEATATLREAGFTASFRGDGDVVIRQMPTPPERLSRDSTIILYTEGGEATRVAIPNVHGMTLADANRAIVNAGLNVRLRGPSARQGRMVVTFQSPAAGVEVEAGSVVTIEFRDTGIQY